MAGEARFTPGEEDAVEAGRDGFRRWLGQPAQRRTLLWLALAFGTIGLALTLSQQRPFEWLLRLWLYGLFGVTALLALAVLGQLATLGRTARRLFRQDKGVHVEQVFSWTDEALCYRSSAGEGRIAWRDLHRWSEGRKTYLFWTTERTCVYLPRRSLDAALTADLRRTLAGFGPPHF